MSTDKPAPRDRAGRAAIGVVPLLWDLDAQRAHEVLAEIAGLGLRGVQWHEAFAQRAHEVLGLAVAEVYAAIACDRDGPAATAAADLRARLDRLHRLGGDVLVVACDGDPHRDRWAGRAAARQTPRLTRGGWQRLAAVVDGIAQQAHALGHRVAFHAHAGTHVETPTELETLLAMTDPDLVGVCLDTGHHIVGGGDPVAVLDGHGRRVTHVHLKDVAAPVLAALRSGGLDGLGHAVDQRIFCPLGAGVLDLPATLAALRSAGYQGWLMLEQDSSWDPPAVAVAASQRALDAALHEPA